MDNHNCISCGHSFEAEKKNEQIKVILSNPGEVLIDGSVTSCPHCKCQSAEGGDLKKIFGDFDDAYEKQNKKFKEMIPS